jgi:hypothetical protein
MKQQEMNHPTGAAPHGPGDAGHNAVLRGAPVMIAAWAELELCSLGKLSRDQLIALVLRRRDQLGLKFDQEWLEDQPTQRLRVLLMAARLLGLLRHRDNRVEDL